MLYAFNTNSKKTEIMVGQVKERKGTMGGKWTKWFSIMIKIKFSSTPYLVVHCPKRESIIAMLDILLLSGYWKDSML